MRAFTTLCLLGVASAVHIQTREGPDADDCVFINGLASNEQEIKAISDYIFAKYPGIEGQVVINQDVVNDFRDDCTAELAQTKDDHSDFMATVDADHPYGVPPSTHELPAAADLPTKEQCGALNSGDTSGLPDDLSAEDLEMGKWFCENNVYECFDKAEQEQRQCLWDAYVEKEGGLDAINGSSNADDTAGN